MNEIAIIATKKVRKQIENLPRDIKSKIDELLDVLKISPIPVKTHDVSAFEMSIIHFRIL